ncbi:MAG: PaaI family thioesterase [Desulfamplus sp.]|nr:PaaI family thioesterase [Desulfamplus sp.]
MDMTNGTFHSRVEINENHRQQDGFTHAGVMATMADQTAGYAAFTTVAQTFQILTIEFKINFLKPAFGKALECFSKVIRRGRQIIIAESEIMDIRDGEEVAVAKAMVTLMAVPKDSLKRAV